MWPFLAYVGFFGFMLCDEHQWYLRISRRLDQDRVEDAGCRSSVEAKYEAAALRRTLKTCCLDGMDCTVYS
jgi:hypothetical protein